MVMVKRGDGAEFHTVFLLSSARQRPFDPSYPILLFDPYIRLGTTFRVVLFSPFI